MLPRRQLLKGSAAIAALTAWPELGFAADGVLSDAPINLCASEVQRPLLPGRRPSRLFLYDGISPGPTIRRQQGDRLRVLFHNDLSVPSTIHWHGVRLTNRMDGVPNLTQAPVRAGETYLYDFILPDAGTYWYHAHFNSLEQVARGLYGPLIIEGDTSLSSSSRDVVLTLDDWWIDDDGRFVDGFTDWSQGKPGGRIGNIATVNGNSPGQLVEIPAATPVRLRLINAANAREFFPDFKGAEAKVVAVDGQPLAEPHPVTGPLRLGPAQRLDLMVRLPSGGEARLAEASGTLLGNQTLAVFRAGPPDKNAPQNVQLRPPNLTRPGPNNALQIPLVMTGGSSAEIAGARYQDAQRNLKQLVRAQQVWAFNQTADLPKQPLFRAKRGASVLVQMENLTGWSHAMHVHGHHFQVLNSRDDLDAKAWRDTVMIDRNQKVEIAFVVDNPGRWLLHCHMLQHAVSGMRTWFEVV
ncbi:MAG: multicopper oxidase family protein [Rhizobiaceae bacterium]